MPSPTGVKLIHGCAAFGTPGRAFTDAASCEPLFDALASKGDTISGLDTAQLYDSYGGSETFIGACGAGQRFSIDTKAYGGMKPGSGTREGIVKDLEGSLERLRVKKVDILYLHAPDATVPLEETLAGINDVHKRGLITRFGLSNFLPADVQRVHDHCSAYGYTLPTVYQGNYSVFNRASETLLLPLLRRLGIAFYCYSALAGGFVIRTKQEVLDGKGRFEASSIFGELYRDLYVRPALLDALDGWARIAREEDCGGAELAYRWVRFNGALKAELGDGVVFGVSRVEQLEDTLAWLGRGPVSEKACKEIDAMWETIKGEAALDTVNRGSLSEYS